jgi:Gpi18-like mannosyltransferase
MLASLKDFYQNNKNLIAVALISYVFVLFFIDANGFGSDVYLFQKWSEIIFKNGLNRIYEPNNGVDYMPVYLYCLKIYTLFVPEYESISNHYYLIKGFILFCDMLVVLIIASSVKDREKKLVVFVVGFLNIGFLYNNLGWHQVDGILTFLLLISFLFIRKAKIFYSIIVYCIALNFKFQAIVFLPIYGLLWLQSTNSLKDGIKYFSTALITCIVIYLPFFLNGSAKFIFATMKNSMGHYPYVTMNARNIWTLICAEDTRFLSDTTPFLGATYHFYGLLLYALSVLIIIAVFIYFQFYKKLKILTHTNFVLLSLILLGYVFYFFNTQMHERYIHYILVFILMYCVINSKWLLWFIFTFVYFLSLEHFLMYHNVFKSFSFLFDPKFQAVCFGLIFIYFIIDYIKSIKQLNLRSLNE